MNYQTPIGSHNGDTWEKLCQVCLNIRFKGNYIEVPASPGDYGIDGYILLGETYQFYCPERECSDKDLYDSQRDKITIDINKLKSYKDDLIKLFNGIKIKRWYLLTPKITSNDLLFHCNKKTELVKSWNLPFIDDDFTVVPLDYKHIAAELETAYNMLDYTTQENIAHKIDIQVNEIDPSEIEEYKLDISNNTQTNNAQQKHKALFPKDGNDYTEKIVKRVDRTVGNLLIGDSILKEWEIFSQDQLERFNKLINVLEIKIEEVCEIPTTNNSERYKEIKEIVQKQIDKDFASLSTATRMRLSERVIADWLLRCPLNFE